LLVGGAVAIGLLALFKSQATAAPPGIPKATPVNPADLGAFSPVLGLPGLTPAYKLLAPAYKYVVAPTVKLLNKTITPTVNGTIPGFTNPDGAITTTPDGTRTVTNPNWYTRNVGDPVSHAGTAVVHFFGGLF
jgi:hypothetical protein